jgi:hypothetical protein
MSNAFASKYSKYHQRIVANSFSANLLPSSLLPPSASPLFNGISQLTGNLTNSPIPPLFQQRIHGKGRKEWKGSVQPPIPFSFFPSSAAKAAANFTAMNLTDDGNWRNGGKANQRRSKFIVFQPIKGFRGNVQGNFRVKTIGNCS